MSSRSRLPAPLIAGLGVCVSDTHVTSVKLKVNIDPFRHLQTFARRQQRDKRIGNHPAPLLGPRGRRFRFSRRGHVDARIRLGPLALSGVRYGVRDLGRRRPGLALQFCNQGRKIT